MNRKRNVSFIKPEDPAFLKALKKEAGFDDKNHKFDELKNDFVEDDDSEKPQVVVLETGDLTAEEAQIEQKKLEKIELETKADLSQKVIFKAKPKSALQTSPEMKKRKLNVSKDNSKLKNTKLLSFNNDDDEEDSNDDNSDDC